MPINFKNADGHYLLMEEDTPFGRKFNQVSGDYWVSTGRSLGGDEIILQILIDDYNHQHKDKS